jgi:hypothetical protein
MTKDKWNKIAEEEVAKVEILNDPEQYPKFRVQVLNFIDEMDRLTEVYNMENKVKTDV